MKFKIRYGNYIPLRKLPGNPADEVIDGAPIPMTPNPYMLILDSQDIKESCSVMGIRSMGKITGVLARERNGDFSDFYVTESSRPYSLDAEYRRVTVAYTPDHKDAGGHHAGTV